MLHGTDWKCDAPDHVHTEPDILDASTVWHVLGIIKTHQIIDWDEIECECGWISDSKTFASEEYYEHLDDAVFYTLRNMDSRI